MGERKTFSRLETAQPELQTQNVFPDQSPVATWVCIFTFSPGWSCSFLPTQLIYKYNWTYTCWVAETWHYKGELKTGPISVSTCRAESMVSVCLSKASTVQLMKITSNQKCWHQVEPSFLEQFSTSSLKLLPVSNTHIEMWQHDNLMTVYLSTYSYYTKIFYYCYLYTIALGYKWKYKTTDPKQYKKILQLSSVRIFPYYFLFCLITMSSTLPSPDLKTTYKLTYQHCHFSVSLWLQESPLR